MTRKREGSDHLKAANAGILWSAKDGVMEAVGLKDDGSYIDS